MPIPNPLLTQRAVVLTKIETTYNVDSVPVAANDAMLVNDPDYTVDPSVLERNFSRTSLSMLPHTIGRKLAGMKFGLEFRGSGDITIAPRIGRHLRACGYAETQIATTAAQVGAVKTDPAAAVGPVVTWGTPTMGGSSPPEPILYKIAVTTAGVSGTAKVSITPDANAVASGYDAVQGGAGVTITTATPLPLKSGGGGAGITPTFAGALVLGQTWWVWAYPMGWLYTPVSSSFESVSNYMYFDGILHKLPGGRGTFTLEGTAGQFPMATFTYTGQYVAPIDAAIPGAAGYEATQPPMVELAHLTIDEYIAVVNKFSFDQGNRISPRSDVNLTDGYNGVNIVGRDPKGGIDPEMTLVANEDFWSSLSTAERMLFRMRFGSAVGNRQWVLAPAAQYTGLTYANRDSYRVLDAGLRFPQWISGDDEISFFFG
jgi:hypothetical protein